MRRRDSLPRDGAPREALEAEASAELAETGRGLAEPERLEVALDRCVGRDGGEPTAQERDLAARLEISELEGEEAKDATGTALAGGIDFNGDGHGDLVIGAPQVNVTSVDDPVAGCDAGDPCGNGKVYIIYFDPTDSTTYPNLGNPGVPDVIDLGFARTLRNAGPWGSGFPEPLWNGDFELLEQRTVGENHLKLRVRPAAGGRPVDAIAFNQAGPSFRGVVHIAYRLDVNKYRGVERPQLVVEQITPLQQA